MPAVVQVLDRAPFVPAKGPKLKRDALIFRDIEGTPVPKEFKLTIWNEANDVQPGKYSIDLDSAIRVDRFGQVTLQLDSASLRLIK